MNIVKKIATATALALAIASNAYAVESAKKEDGVNVADVLLESLGANFCQNFPPYCPMISDTLVEQSSQTDKQEEQQETLRKRK
ncbi:hypothetical protein [Thalassotalea marina]|uniref:Uncharacterized protein n=1 Tax=Thalassotalea marina TaxID=1673741 RepID=A0A919EIK5_9GAMM|nr:hypothetical protein [Thalassotalea marina]GHF84786.1 hypothetical protein GCM10017161_10330 [Thalassotalea marina]